MVKRKKIKVAHFSFSDDYGAWGAAYELHKCLLEKGVESTLFVRNKTRDDNSIVELEYCNSAKERIFYLINKLYFNENRRDLGVAPINFDCVGLCWNRELENILKDYDIFHVHWVANFLNIDDIFRLSMLNKPIIWTMHDFHPFTGGCHYPETCKKYETNCSECFELKNNYTDITKEILLEKQYKYSKNIYIVVASEWLKCIVQKSKVFGNNPCKVIPIGIDTDCFIPKNKKEIKEKMGINENTKVILVGAQSLSQNIKGYVHLKCILDAVSSNAFCAELIKAQRLVLLTFGSDTNLFEYYHDIRIINMGFINDRKKMCETYNAADVFVFPSIQDTFGMTAVEAMSCGVPTVAFDVSAMHDVIVNGKNGYKAAINDYSFMADYIIKILKENTIDKNICRNCIVDRYSLKCETEKMSQFYSEVVNTELIAPNESKQGNKALETFIKKSIFEIFMGVAPNQNINMTIQEIFLEFNPYFVSPEQKVKKLISDKGFNAEMLIYIYGAGEFGKRTLKQLKRDGICIEKFWDMDKNKGKKFIEGYKVEEPIKKEEMFKGKIIIAGYQYLEMIKNLLYLGYSYGQDFY